MNTIKFYDPFKTLLVVLVLQGVGLKAQVNYTDFITSGEHDSYYKVAVRERQAIAWPSLREADVKYSHRIIRCIDIRQKMNKALDWPRQPLSTVLYDALWEGYITPFRNDSMVSFYNTFEFRRKLGYETPIFYSTDPEDPTIGIDTVIWVQREAREAIKKFWILEDWIFDAKHSVFKPRILAIAPVYKPQFQNVTANEQPLCWIPMDDKLRNMLAGTELFNRYNQAARLSYDDFFQMRLFDSYVIYESNVFDNHIAHFAEFENDGVGALLENDRIKNDLFVFEHDLWQY